MTLFFRQIRIVFWKDILVEFRNLTQLYAVLLFGILSLLLFSFALSVDPDVMKRMASGLFWLAILFSAVISLDHSFRKEREEGQREGLLLLGIDPRALYLGKFFANFAFLILMNAVFLPLMSILYDLTLTTSLVSVLLLGSLGIATLGTFYAGLTSTFREGQALLPVLLFPMLVPVLLAAVKVTDLMLARDVFGQQVAWAKLLLVFDAVFLAGSLLFAETLFEGI